MVLYCWYCHKPVSNELPDTTVFRAIATCPECIEKDEDVPLEYIYSDNPNDDEGDK